MLTNSRRGTLLRSLLVACALLAWLAVGAFGGMAQGQLSTVQENDPSVFLPESAESTRASEIIDEFSVDETFPALVVIERSDGGALDREDFAVIGDVAQSIPGLDLPDETTIGDYLSAEQVPAIPSEDGEAALLPVSLDAATASDLIGEEEDRVSVAVVDRLRAEVSQTLPDAGLEGWVTGPAAGAADLVSAFAGIDGILLGVALAVVLVILAFVYRSPLLPFAVILTSVFSLCLAALVIVPLAGADVLLLNGQSQGILSILVIGAATDYSLLLVARYREELTRHEHPAAAMRAAWRATLEPIAASAGTVIVGLLCLLLSDLGSNASLGPVAAIGIVAAVFGALTLLPALLLIPGSRARVMFWPKRPVLDGAGRHREEGSHGLWARVADVVGRRARRVWVVTAMALLALAAFVPTFDAAGTSDNDVFLNETESVTGEEVLADHFAVGTVQPVEIVADESAAADVVAAAEQVPGVVSASVLTDSGQGNSDQGGSPPGGSDEAGSGQDGSGAGAPTEGEPLVVEGRVLVEVITSDSAESQEVLTTVTALREAMAAVEGETLVGGAAAERLDTQETAERDLRTIVPVVLVVIAVMLMLLLRSLVAPLVLLAANVLSFAATMGLAAIVFNHVLDFPGADATVPLYGFVFLVALGIDYSIFLMTRVREESLQLGTRAGVRRGLAVTGGVITSAGLVLAATFSALWVIPLLFLAQLAFIVAVGVLIDTFVVRSLLVPGVVHDLGRRSWWPWAKRVPADPQ
ncbi:MMPL family transporter [Ruania alkalisoli]|uniref:MMPL family transporter n=1 Tax=Ruania alkalisoli TaxID=2779775 RepID=A0A7M1SW12_9MICO|nr:MMPL family transporter [Ruania alkalisoli]QOR71725.1 MMPL family transporter [Ruania alkalisoli]